MNTILHYSYPEREYMSGLPFGGKSLAAMGLCEGNTHRIALNHEALWRGKHSDRTCRNVSHRLPLVRELLLKRDFESAKFLSNYYFGGGGGLMAHGKRIDAYQPAGDLIISVSESDFTSYERSLDLEKALFSAKYTQNNKKYSLSSFIDINSGTLVSSLSCDTSSDCLLALSRIPDRDCSLTYSGDDTSCSLTGRFPEGVVFTIYMKVITDGTSKVTDKGVSIKDFTSLKIFLSVSLSETPELPPSLNYDRIYSSHVSSFSRMFNRVSLTLEGEESKLDTDQRVRRFREGGESLVPLLYFNFGRYLLICGSTGSLPLNLQGKWNDELRPPWEADYHNNINLQMNYWFAEELGYSDCHRVLCDFILSMEESGRDAARKLYGCRGIYISQTTDASAKITPESFGYAVWVGAAPWFCAHLMKHYDYSLDKDYLRDKSYPFMKGCAKFFEDYLYDVNGTLEIMPSQSPENSFKECGPPLGVSICVSSAMDCQLVAELLALCIRAAGILGVDGDKVELWKDILSRLSKVKIGSDGRILEWGEEFTESEPGHRHVSHLYGLYPSNLFAPGDDLYNAAERSLDERMRHGGGHTGWSRAWTSCLMARLNRGADAYEHLRALICDFATTSLLDLHPPRIFQIDGNMGGAAAVRELLVRSCYGKIELLPAIEGLPNEWQSGKLEGFRAEGNVEISMEWKNGRMVWYDIKAPEGSSVIVSTPGG
ncbi:MAG: hypothetical protein GX633_03590 [Clostridiales bacterium]|nr:hypothetical protein [Clostridiales bacterium]